MRWKSPVRVGLAPPVNLLTATPWQIVRLESRAEMLPRSGMVPGAGGEYRRTWSSTVFTTVTDTAGRLIGRTASA